MNCSQLIYSLIGEILDQSVPILGAMRNEWSSLSCILAVHLCLFIWHGYHVVADMYRRGDPRHDFAAGIPSAGVYTIHALYAIAFHLYISLGGGSSGWIARAPIVLLMAFQYFCIRDTMATREAVYNPRDVGHRLRAKVFPFCMLTFMDILVRFPICELNPDTSYHIVVTCVATFAWGWVRYLEEMGMRTEIAIRYAQPAPAQPAPAVPSDSFSFSSLDFPPDLPLSEIEVQWSALGRDPETVCGICLMDLNGVADMSDPACGKPMDMLVACKPCFHAFHYHCFSCMAQQMRRVRCPMCRAD